MALSAEQIAALLGAGKTNLGKSPDWRKSLLAIINKPSSLTALRGSAESQAVTSYDPAQSYLDEQNRVKMINKTKQRWKMMGSQYDNLVEDYSAMLKQTGGAGDFQTYIDQMMTDKLPEFSQKYGLDPAALTSVVTELNKDKKSFLTEESRIQRDNMKAFYQKKRSAADIMKGATGISGLENVAATPEELLSIRTRQAAESLLNRPSAGHSKETAADRSAYVQKLIKDYGYLIKKEVKGVKNPLAYTLGSAIKKTSGA